MVATTPIPSVVSGIWAQLYHSKRRLCTRVRMAVAAGSDKGIDILHRGPRRFLRMQTKP
jgi:hypothetical protein